MKSFHSLKDFTLSRGGGGGVKKVSDLRFSHFVAPLPVINDQSPSFVWSSEN